MSTIPSVYLGMAAFSGIASANVSIAAPVFSQNLCLWLFQIPGQEPFFFSTAGRRRVYTIISDAITSVLAAGRRGGHYTVTGIGQNRWTIGD